MATMFPWRTLGPHVHVEEHKVNPVVPTAPHDGHLSETQRSVGLGRLVFK